MSGSKYINVDGAIICIDDITDGIDAAEFNAKWIKGFLSSFPTAPIGGDTMSDDQEDGLE